MVKNCEFKTMSSAKKDFRNTINKITDQFYKSKDKDKKIYLKSVLKN